MASIEKTPSGKYRVTVSVKYKRYSATFKTKAECNAWAVQIENNRGFNKSSKTFGDLLDNYRDKISVNKQGERWETIRIEKFKRDKIANIRLSALTKHDFADWRDRRMKEVSNASVIREWALLNHALEISIREWEWLEVNPMKGLKKPASVPPRDRIFTDDEIERLCFALNYYTNEKPEQIISRVGAAMMFAIETALRAQELCNLKWVDTKGRVIKVIASKTRAGVREVPLSPKAMDILEQMRGFDDTYVFAVNTSQVDSLFRKAKKQTGIVDLHWHDTRHTAITRLAQKLSVLDLARCIGHKDLNMLLVYYNANASELADKL